MKKIILLLVIFVFILSGCFHKKEETRQMDVPVEDGSYYYENKDLGFSIVLPPEFMHYQTQRKSGENFIDLQIFVPTADDSYGGEIPDYGNPITVRIFEKEAWENIDEADKLSFYRELGEKEGKVYALKIWKDLPSDWQWKWTIEMEDRIVKSFKTI